MLLRRLALIHRRIMDRVVARVVVTCAIALTTLGCAADKRTIWAEARTDEPETGRWLFVMTSSPPLDFSSLQKLTESLRKNPRGKHDGTVGHAWLRVIGPDGDIECGHTGDEGYEVESYEQGLLRRLREADPNPVGYLWQPLNDGSMQRGSGGFVATLAVRRRLSAEEFEQVWSYIESYDFRCYALRGPQCTTFVLGALERIGIRLNATRHIPVAREQRFWGARYVFWSDPRYAELDLPIPQVLEDRLREAIDRGEFIDVTDWYPNLRPIS